MVLESFSGSEQMPFRLKDLENYKNGEDLRLDILHFREVHPNYTWENLRPRSLNALREGNPYLFVLYPKLHVPVAMAFAIEGMLGIAENIKSASYDPETGEPNLKLYGKARVFIENTDEELGFPEGISHAEGIFNLGQEASSRFGIEIPFTPQLQDVAFRFIERMNSEVNGLRDPQKGPLVAAIMEASGSEEEKKKGDDGWMPIEFGDIKAGGRKLGLSTQYADDNLLADYGHGRKMCDTAVELPHLDQRFALSANGIQETLAAVYDVRGRFWYELDEVINQQFPDIWNF